MRYLAIATALLAFVIPALTQQNADQKSKQKTAKRPVAQGAPVGGHVGIHQVENRASTTGSVGRTTPGINTEAGRAQAPGKSNDVPVTAPANLDANQSGAPPHDPLLAGQTANEADVNAQAAARAEFSPGATLGTTGAPTSHQPQAQSSAGANRAGQNRGVKRPATKPSPQP